MLYTWNWLTFILYLGTTMTIAYLLGKIGNYNSYNNIYGLNKYKGNKILVFLFFYFILMFFPLFRDINLYPAYAYATENNVRTIDTQAYVYQFLVRMNPGYHFDKILTLNQTEPLTFTIANFVLDITNNNLQVLWFVLYSIMAFSYIYFFSNTLVKDYNAALLMLFFLIILFSLSGIRSGLSVSMFYLGLAAYTKRRKITMLVAFIAGFLFHYIIIFGIVAIIYNCFIERRKKEMMSMIFIVMLTISGIMIFKGAAVLFVRDTKYFSYLEVGGMSLIGQVPALTLMILCLLNYDRIKKEYPDKLLYVRISIFRGTLVPVLLFFAIDRMNLYFLLSSLYAWGLVLNILEKKFCIMVRYLGVLGTLIWFIKRLYDMKGDGIMPLFNKVI